MDIEAFEKSLKEGVGPIYCFVGNQTFLMDLVVESIREIVAAGAFADMNVNVYHGDERGAGEKALQTMGQFPMMAKQRLVILREAEKIKGKALDQIADYLLKPNDFCCLVLCYEKLKKSTKTWKRSNKNGVAIAFDKIFPRQMPYWVKRMAKASGKKISGGGVDYLVQAVGADLSKANSEIEKASLYSDTDSISKNDLEAVLASVKDESIFEMTDAIGQKDRLAALYLIKKMLDAGEQPLRILWQVSSHMKRLMLVRSHLISRTPANEIGRAMGVMDFIRDKLIRQAKVFSRRELRLSLVLLTKTDLELKSGRVSGRAVLEKLVLDLCASTSSKKRA
jgi:DNA polymerase-3 subunit delta